MPKRFGLPARERLKSRKQIDALFSSGRRFTQFPLRVTYRLLPATDSAGAQVGVTVSKKNFGKASDRNRIKRRLREAYRLQKEELVQILKEKNIQAAIFLMYTDSNMASFDVVKEAVKKSIGQLVVAARQIKHENPS